MIKLSQETVENLMIAISSARNENEKRIALRPGDILQYWVLDLLPDPRIEGINQITKAMWYGFNDRRTSDDI